MAILWRRKAIYCRRMDMLQSLQRWAAALKRDVLTLWLAARDPRVPWPAKILAGAVAAYVLSPVDLIPDFVPILGYLDDLIIAPLGMAWALSMIPKPVLADLREKAGDHTHRPVSRAAAVGVVTVWLATAAAVVWLVWPSVNHVFYPD